MNIATSKFASKTEELLKTIRELKAEIQVLKEHNSKLIEEMRQTTADLDDNNLPLTMKKQAN